MLLCMIMICINMLLIVYLCMLNFSLLFFTPAFGGGDDEVEDISRESQLAAIMPLLMVQHMSN